MLYTSVGSHRRATFVSSQEMLPCSQPFVFCSRNLVADNFNYRPLTKCSGIWPLILSSNTIVDLASIGEQKKTHKRTSNTGATIPPVKQLACCKDTQTRSFLCGCRYRQRQGSELPAQQASDDRGAAEVGPGPRRATTNAVKNGAR